LVREAGGSDRRARRQERAREFGRRHPRLTAVICCLFLAGGVAVVAVQLGHGTYLGRGWLIAALAGIAAAVVLGAAAVISNLRHGPALGRVEWAWTILTFVSVSAIRVPFPAGPYGGVQALFNVVHATLLGYAVVSYTALTVLLAYVQIRPRGLPGRLEVWRPLPHAAEAHGIAADPRQIASRRGPRAIAWPGWVLAGAVAGLVAAVILAGVGGPNAHDAANAASGRIGLLALAALCVAVPAVLYRWYRARRHRAVPPGLRRQRHQP
jgi:hypothetical protein